MAKFFYFARRNPALSVPAFTTRWRGHCALAKTMRSWDNKLLYVQADALLPPPGIETPGEYDGFCYGLTESQGLLQPATPQDEANDQILLTDELVVFDGAILPRVMLFEEEVLLAGGFGVVACLAFHDLDVARAVGESHAAKPGLERVIVNRVQYAGSHIAAAQFAAVVEICASDEARLLAALGGDEAASWRSAAVIVLAKENILWDRRAGQTG